MAFGDIHFDDSEIYVSRSSSNVNSVQLLKVAVHEIGHVLGLNHSLREYSIMYALYKDVAFPQMSMGILQDFELGWEDRKYVQNIYGKYHSIRASC